MADKEIDEVKKAMEIIDEMSADPNEWEMYESRRKAIINYNSGMAYARREGEKSGLEKGKKKAKFETAKKLLKLGLDIETISKATDLSREEIRKLHST